MWKIFLMTAWLNLLMNMALKILRIYSWKLKILRLKNAKWEDRKYFKLNNTITFVYSSIMDFPQNKFEIKTVVTKEFFNNVRDLIYGEYVIHHSHVTGEIIGYTHDFCIKKIRENNNVIPVFAHNLFSFDFFFVVKGIKIVLLENKTVKYRWNKSNKCTVCQHW